MQLPSSEEISAALGRRVLTAIVFFLPCDLFYHPNHAFQVSAMFVRSLRFWSVIDDGARKL